MEQDRVEYLKKEDAMSSSPTHEFSFTVSLPRNPPQTPLQRYTDRSLLQPHEPFDLTPADDIFFHGHLLPLHLSHLPVSPRSSTNSLDSFTLPIKDLPIGNTSFHCHHQTTFSDFDQPQLANNQPKSKSFSLFGIPKSKNDNRKKLKLDLGQLIKRYMKMVRPLLSFPKSRTRRSNTTCNHQSYSFSGNSLRSSKQHKRRGQFSAPASMKTSPGNSGILLASGTVSPTKSTTSESTMEELHAAIQAAIAHCKNSIAMEDKQN